MGIEKLHFLVELVELLVNEVEVVKPRVVESVPELHDWREEILERELSEPEVGLVLHDCSLVRGELKIILDNNGFPTF